MEPMGPRDKTQEILDGQLKARYNADRTITVYLWPESDKNIEIWINGIRAGYFTKSEE